MAMHTATLLTDFVDETYNTTSLAMRAMNYSNGVRMRYPPRLLYLG